MSSPRRSLDRQEIINNVIALIHKKVAPEQAKLVEPFVRQYYATMAEEDLCLPDILDLYGAALSHWNFLYERKPGQMKVRVFNPRNESHGWQSIHTIVEIAFEDYRFAVDSVRMELNRHGLTVHLINHP